MKFFIIYFACIALVHAAMNIQTWPNINYQGMGIVNQQCRRSDPNVEQCILNKIALIRPSLQHLIEPFVMDQIHVDTSISGAKLKATLRNFIAYRGSNFQIQHLKVNLYNRNQYTGEVKIGFPQVFVAADYHFKGTKYLLIHFDTNGKFKVVLTNFSIVFNWIASPYINHGVEFLKVDSATAKISIGDVHLKLYRADDTWAGKEIISYAESDPAGSLRKLTPAIEDKVAQLFKELCNNVLTTVPLNKLLVD